MSVEAVTWAFRQGTLKPGVRFVLVALADRSNHEGVCWPSYDDLSERTGYSVRQVIRNVQELVAVGLVEQIERFGRRGKQTSPLYVLHFELGVDFGQVGGSILSRAKATARMPRPGCVPERAVDKSTGERVDVHAPMTQMSPPYDKMSPLDMSQMSPLESCINHKDSGDIQAGAVDNNDVRQGSKRFADEAQKTDALTALAKARAESIGR